MIHMFSYVDDLVISSKSNLKLDEILDHFMYLCFKMYTLKLNWHKVTFCNCQSICT